MESHLTILHLVLILLLKLALIVAGKLAFYLKSSNQSKVYYTDNRIITFSSGISKNNEPQSLKVPTQPTTVLVNKPDVQCPLITHQSDFEYNTFRV